MDQLFSNIQFCTFTILLSIEQNLSSKTYCNSYIYPNNPKI